MLLLGGVGRDDVLTELVACLPVLTAAMGSDGLRTASGSGGLQLGGARMGSTALITSSRMGPPPRRFGRQREGTPCGVKSNTCVATLTVRSPRL